MINIDSELFSKYLNIVCRMGETAGCANSGRDSVMPTPIAGNDEGRRQQTVPREVHNIGGAMETES